MDQNISNNNEHFAEEQGSFSVIEWLLIFVKYWYLFLIGAIIGVGIAYYQNRSFVPLYNSYTRVLLKQEKGSFSLMQNFNTGLDDGRSVNIENQQIILSSLDLVQRTIDSLPSLKITFFEKLKYRDRAVLGQSPVDIELISATEEGYENYYLFVQNNKDSFIIEVFDQNDDLKERVSGTYDKLVGCQYFLIKAQKNANFSWIKQVNFRIRSEADLVREFAQRLQSTITDKTSVLNIILDGPDPTRDMAFLDQHVKSFLADNLDKKNYEANKTIVFINEQLSSISDSLNRAESKLSTFRINNKMYANNEGSALSNRLQTVVNRGKELDLRDSYFKYLKNYLKKNLDDETIASPTSVGIGDTRLMAIIDQYNAKQTSLKGFGIKHPKREIVIDELTQIKSQISELINSMSTIFDIERQAHNADKNQIERMLVEAPSKELKMLDYERRFRINNEYYTFLLQKLSEAQIRKASNVPDNTVLQQAKYIGPQNMDSKRRRYIVLFVLGLLLPAIFLIVRERLRSTIATERDVEKITSYPVIGAIRHTQAKTSDSPIVAQKYPNSIFVEQIRVIRTKIELILRRRNNITALISSAESGDGKTYIAMNIAGVFALQKKKVLLIDFDIRKPNMSNIIIQDKKLGFVNYTLGDCSIEEAICKTEYGFDFLPVGVIPPNPGEYIRSREIEQMLSMLKEMYSIVIIDTSPLGLVTDAYALLPHSDVNLLVVRSLRTNKMSFKSLVTRMHNDKVDQTYIVLNDISRQKIGYKRYAYGGSDYGYGYGYGYVRRKKISNYYTTSEFEKEDLSIPERIYSKVREFFENILDRK